jgi:ATP-dependent DNA ligase
LSNITKERLQIEVTKRNIYLEDGVAWTNDNLIKRLGSDTLFRNRHLCTWGRMYMHSLHSPMLIDHYKKYIKNIGEDKDPLTSEHWIAEEKANGFRCIVAYSPEFGFELFSRRESVETFLNGDFTNKTAFIKNGLIKYPKDFIKAFKYRFVLDCEVMVNSDVLYLDGVEYTSVEDFLQALLGSNPERAISFQKDGGAKLSFRVFDVLYFEKEAEPYEKVLPEFKFLPETITAEDAEWVESKFYDYLESISLLSDKAKKKQKKVWEKAPGKNIYIYLNSLRDSLLGDVRKYPFGKRRKLRKALVEFLQKVNLPFELVGSEDVNKTEFTEEIIRSGGEGAILKNLHAPYFSALKNRSHRASLKVKTSVSIAMANSGINEDFDVFILGVNQPKSKAMKEQGIFASLKVGVYLQKQSGETVLHEIANVAGIHHDVKKEMGNVLEDGTIELKEEYMDKVIAIDGMSLSHLNLRFNHATLKGKKIELKAKNPTDCIYDEEQIKGMVTVRGE